MDRLTILLAAYPFAAVSEDAVGGAEQVLSILERGLARAGHQTVVIAQPGVPEKLDEAAIQAGRRRHAALIAGALDSMHVDVIHTHGLDFYEYLPDTAVPIVSTLHLPVEFYPEDLLKNLTQRVIFNCVSVSQQRTFAERGISASVIRNGVEVERFQWGGQKSGFALCLGRICPEKNFECAIEAAKRAGCDLLIAGRVFPYEWHQKHFAERLAPLLDGRRRFIGPVGFAEKRRLLGEAKCLLIPSTVAETSSLVAMEALASGTPVIAFPSGALPEIIEPGRTGYLVNSAEEMAEAIAMVNGIDGQECLREARERFSSQRMVCDYVALYGATLGRIGNRNAAKKRAGPRPTFGANHNGNDHQIERNQQEQGERYNRS